MNAQKAVMEECTFTLAIAGQPNTGKSTVFNGLTGSKQHVGNWPGKTVEQKIGYFKDKGVNYQLVDLPGTYSLTAASLEEVIARDFVIKEKPDVVIIMVDASQLERTLYLAAEAIILSAPIILALNMMDVAKEEGRKIDPKAMERALGIKVIPMIASKREGFSDLLNAIQEVISNRKNYSPSKPQIGQDYRSDLENVQKLISRKVPVPYHEDWVAIKLMEKDKNIIELIKNEMEPVHWNNLEQVINRNSKGPLIAASSRYEWIQQVVSTSVVLPEKKGKVRFRNKFDKKATHPIIGPFIAIGILLLSMIAIMGIGFPLSMITYMIFGMISNLLKVALVGAPDWLNSMLTDGLIPGIGISFAVFFFLLASFLVIGYLEDRGYLPRLAYLMDRVMSKMGLHGKSFMPLFMSLSCNMVGVMGSRVEDNSKQRLTTLFLAPIVPCMALWSIIPFITILFFGAFAPIVILFLFIAMFLHLFLTSLILRRTVIKGEHTGIIMELPPYHKPNWKTIWTYAWTHGKAFLKRGGTIIAIVLFVIWTLSYFPNGQIETSFLATIGQVLEPIGAFMGMDWRLMICLLVAIFSKEGALSAMAVIYGIGGAMASSIPDLFGTHFSGTVFGATLLAEISPASALGFVFAIFFSIPCLSTIGMIYGESKSLKWTIGFTSYYLLSSFLWGVIGFNFGNLIFV